MGLIEFMSSIFRRLPGKEIHFYQEGFLFNLSTADFLAPCKQQKMGADRVHLSIKNRQFERNNIKQYHIVTYIVVNPLFGTSCL
jgi:hypothetical protein